jgi:penicillin-binding protein 1A
VKIKFKLKKIKLTWLTFLAVLSLGTALIAVGSAGAYIAFSPSLPEIMTVADYRPPGVTRILGGAQGDQDGKETELLAEFYRNERRYVVPYEAIPEKVIRAFVAAEDDSFFEHQGINFVAIVRAAIANFRAGQVVQGGSTITQQVAKSLLLTPERSFLRKIRELILAGRMEKNLTKQQILYLYLNQIYLGNGSYGVQAAARAYFRKDIKEVTAAEAALLAGMPQAPGRYSPLLNPHLAKKRQIYVLRRMKETGAISETEWQQALSEPVKVYPIEDFKKTDAAFYVEHVRRYLLEKYGDKAVYDEGLTVSVPTTQALSAAAARSVQEGLRTVDKRLGWAGPLGRISNEQERSEFNEKIRAEMIARAVPYLILNAKGELDREAAFQTSGISSETKLVFPGELYRALVTQVDESKKVIQVRVGNVRGEIPYADVKWARPNKDERTVIVVKGDPSRPAQILQKGDIIWVRRTGVEVNEPIKLSLEQKPSLQAALVSIEANTGRVLALQGGYEFSGSEFNRAVQAQRQPGSSFKPFIYAAAVERGFTPATIIVDSPLVFKSTENGDWKPANFEEKFYGDTPFRQALIKSRNVPTIKLVQAIGVGDIISFARRLGLVEAKFQSDLSISLGSGGTSLLELTQAYSVFPRHGKQLVPIFIHRVRDRDGRVLEENRDSPALDLAQWAKELDAKASTGEPVDPSVVPYVSADAPAMPSVSREKLASLKMDNPRNMNPESQQVLDPRVAFVMTHIMKEVVSFGTGYEAKSLGRVSAGKTGTTNDYLDAWYMGFTPDLVTGVWVGYDTQKPIGGGETGARAALPIWLSYMKDATKDRPPLDFAVPAGVTFTSIDPITGKLLSTQAARAIQEAFVGGTEPGAPGVTSGVIAPTSAGSSDGNVTSGEENEGSFLKEDIQ